MSENTHKARVIIAKIETLSYELTTNISWERRNEIHQKIYDLTEELKEINKQNKKK